MQRRNISGDEKEASTSGDVTRHGSFFSLRCVAGNGRGKKGPAFCQPFFAVETLSEREGPDGDPGRVCDGSPVGDHMLSMDVLKGFRHFRLHPDLSNRFIFRYAGRYIQCVALPFGWGRSPLWFTQRMAPFVTRFRSWG